MELKKEHYIHNHLSFDKSEKDTLNNALMIIEAVRQDNIHSPGQEDEYLNDRCSDIIKNITELLDNYSNEYF